MSAARIRAAAAAMRERAEAAQDVRGVSTWQFGGLTWCDQSGESYDILGGAATVVHGAREEEAEHIASWHPAVALAVAMLLDNEANLIDSVTEYAGLHQPLNTARVQLLLDIANAYLGTSDCSRPGLGTAGVTGAQPDEPVTQAGRPASGGAS